VTDRLSRATSVSPICARTNDRRRAFDLCATFSRRVYAARNVAINATDASPHIEHNRIASEKRKTARTRPVSEGPTKFHGTRGSQTGEVTSKRDRPEAWPPRTAHRGRQALKGTENLRRGVRSPQRSVRATARQRSRGGHERESDRRERVRPRKSPGIPGRLVRPPGQTLASTPRRKFDASMTPPSNVNG